MKLDKDQKRTLLYLTVFALILMCITAYIKKDLKENSVYTVCFVDSYMDGPSSSPAIFYYYYVNGKKYENSNYLDSNYDVKVGEFYVVKFSSKNPDWAEIQQDQRVFSTTKIRKAGLKIPKKKKNQFKF
ncbi:hypothetical protein [Cellulophaga baltica]|uniref:hypothetical protein n=1 Tax=Cellulophaga baltica TaxID=76594 RepID=UPI0015F75146|nr:hypothetical protein [Cellulophaga baltica]MBA6316737.1 hypothetical protein [Cellulophaga baltica]